MKNLTKQLLYKGDNVARANVVWNIAGSFVYAFASMVNQEEMLRKILPAIYLIERLPRNISMHAAGVVLSGDCLNEVVPLTKGPNQNVLTQYSKNYIESVGLLKMDFLCGK